jgi:hypothetical protein
MYLQAIQAASTREFTLLPDEEVIMVLPNVACYDRCNFSPVLICGELWITNYR